MCTNCPPNPQYNVCPRCGGALRYSRPRRSVSQPWRVRYQCGSVFDLLAPEDNGLETYKQLVRCPRDPIAAMGEGI